MQQSNPTCFFSTPLGVQHLYSVLVYGSNHTPVIKFRLRSIASLLKVGYWLFVHTAESLSGPG